MKNEGFLPIWRPSESTVESANLRAFSDFLGMSHATFSQLHRFSIQQAGKFWQAVWEFAKLPGEMGNVNVVQADSMTEWKWFPNGKLNFAEIMLKPERLSDTSFAESLAVIASNELGENSALTRKELYEEVCRFASLLRSQGVVAGDRVVAIVPNRIEAVVSMLGAAAIGAVWSSCSPEFGEDAICDRFGQIAPRVLISTLQVHYNGKALNLSDKLSRVIERLASLETVFLFKDCHGHKLSQTDLSQWNSPLPRIDWHDAIPTTQSSLEFERYPFDHPLAILYSSGTTGTPKCIVHGAGGTVLQHIKEHQLHCDLKPADRLFYYTTTGWMMWNWLLSGLASEACIVLFDGSPLAPDASVLWKLAETYGITHFGASPRYYTSLEKSSVFPSESFDLGKLRCLMSTGSPLLAETFEWIYRHIKSDINLASISGGTDILSCFVLGNPMLPVFAGQIQSKGLGMDVQIFDDQGRTVVGAPGELVCVQPFPSMPIGFWNDPDGSKYRAAYFEQFENVWCHGDWAMETDQGGFVIFGRSDATLNPSGVRIGTAEIYRQVEVFPQIAECLATVLRRDGDEQIVLFLKLAPNGSLDETLVQEIRKRLRERCSARHVPAYIAAAPDLPRTISGKLSELAVRSAISGSSLGNSGALANPESLEFFRTWRPD